MRWSRGCSPYLQELWRGVHKCKWIVKLHLRTKYSYSPIGFIVAGCVGPITYHLQRFSYWKNANQLIASLIMCPQASIDHSCIDIVQSMAINAFATVSIYLRGSNTLIYVILFQIFIKYVCISCHNLHRWNKQSLVTIIMEAHIQHNRGFVIWEHSNVNPCHDTQWA